LGETASTLGDFIAARANFSNNVMGISNQSSIRGLNPGYALGELVVVDDYSEKIDFSDDKIYIINKTAANLNPVAGIATVSEGNLVSHIQLLARNLGIPNAVISFENLKELKKHSGKRVFYAVSNRGTVIMKPEYEMTNWERELFAVKNRVGQKIKIPTAKINLNEQGVLNLRNIRSEDSGKICGPKAANLGQLKTHFPDMVVEGIVIPFGVFREHMNQQIPNTKMSYWEYLNRIFSLAEQIPNKAAAEDYILQELKILRSAIQEISLDQQFIVDLKSQFKAVLGKEIGNIPVFVRSDTNMEDLKDFTGSGLNLTLFNVVEEEKIIQGIREVWASPFKERSYRWRQKYLLNPENVYPSILIIPSVDVDYSGVLITTGITSGEPSDLTVAFSRGAGGAVEGQAAESYLLKANGQNILFSTAREPKYRIIPPSGGSYKVNTTFEQPILKAKNLQSLRALAEEVKRIIPNTPGIDSKGPFDIELGFKDDQIWLFQIRPFVENKNAKGSAYLKSITPLMPIYDPIKISTPL
jgi:phosphoenolpyruvate synthase/pyruvate phosphate dikinase